MTTQANPDGQTQPQASDSSTQGSTQQPAAEEWRNKDEVKKIIAKRDEAAAAAKREKDRADAAERELADLRSKKMQADGDTQGLLAEEQAKRKAAEEKLTAAEREKEERSRMDRRREVVDAILDSAHPQRKEELRLMLPGLHEAGDIDLYAEDAKAEGKKALDKLRKRMPGYFAAGDGANAPTQRGAGRDYSGVDWMDLTPEEQRDMPQEDFRKHFAGRGGGRRRPSALFGSQPHTRK